MYRNAFILIIIWIFIGCNGENDDPISTRDDGLQQYVGFWKNSHPLGGEIEEIIILKKSKTIVLVELRGGCVPDPCEWGGHLLSRKLFEKGVLILDWNFQDVSIHQEFSRTASGKLELTSWEDHVDDRRDTMRTFGFLRDESKPLFEQIPPQEAFRASFSKSSINGSSGDANQLNPGTIILYQTTAGRYGKLQIRGNDAIITMRWECWNADGSRFAKSDYMETKAGGYYDMNLGQELTETTDCMSDFMIEESDSGERWLRPQCGAAFVIYHVEP